MQKQQTLAAPFTLEGKGLHTGLNITATFCPSEPNTGYRFQRIDLEGEPIVEAVADNVAATNRGTVVKKGDITISTIEHAMAALYCLGVDNCLIKLNAPEIPILDGSALPWVKAIQNVGVVEQNAKREIFRIMKKYEVVDEASGVKLEIFPDDHFSVTTFVDYPSPVLNNQFANLRQKGQPRRTQHACCNNWQPSTISRESWLCTETSSSVGQRTCSPQTSRHHR